ncbi:hypothetical protein ACFWFK_31335, partial [Micromonospora chalcea]
MKAKGKSAVCPFCHHVHPLAVHQRLANEGFGEDALLVVAEFDDKVSKRFRPPSPAEVFAAEAATHRLIKEPAFTPLLPAVPKEEIPANNGATIRPQLYGARTYGDLMVARQTLGFVRLSRLIAQMGTELQQDHGVSLDYARALTGYAASVLVRQLRRSTRGATLMVYPDGRPTGVNHIFANEGTIAFSYDFFEVGIAGGSGTWQEIQERALRVLRDLMNGHRGNPAQVQRGTATALPFKSSSMAAVVTDPPYDAMVYYSDSSDFFFAWLKRALHTTRPEMTITADSRGIQEKTEELIVKDHGIAPGEHRDREHYDRGISRAFAEMRRVVAKDGLVTIVFGHGEPEVWHRLLRAITDADLVLTGSWPAKTESGGQQGKANIVTTLTMSCRPAPPDRPLGRVATVESEVKEEIRIRMAQWSRSGLAPTD